MDDDMLTIITLKLKTSIIQPYYNKRKTSASSFATFSFFFFVVLTEKFTTVGPKKPRTQTSQSRWWWRGATDDMVNNFREIPLPVTVHSKCNDTIPFECTHFPKFQIRGCNRDRKNTIFYSRKIAKNTLLHSHEPDKLLKHCERVQLSLSSQTLRFCSSSGRYKEDYDTLRRTQPELQVSLQRGRWLLRIRVLL